MILKAKIYYNSFFTGNKEYQYLPFFRIAVAFIALADVITMGSDFKLFFSEKSTLIPQELTYLFTEYFNYLGPLYAYLKETGNISIFYTSIFWVYISFLVFLMVGFRTRFFAIVALVLQLIIFKSFAIYNFGYDHFLTMSFFYCIIFPVGNFFSLDNFIFKKADRIKYDFNYQNMLRIHLGIVYFFAGIAKIISITWWNGVAIWRSISSIYDELFKIPPILLAIAGIITLILEVGYPFLMINKRTRKYTLIGVIGMHIGVALILQLSLFASIMIVWNITAYYGVIKDLFIKKEVLSCT